MNKKSLNFLWMGLLFLSVNSMVSGCKRNAPTPSSEIYFKKTSCFGTCPIYSMTIQGSGLATFEGIRFTEKIGKHTKELSSEEVKRIFNGLASLDWNEIDELYPTNISDLPSTIIKLKHRKIDRKVIIAGEHPAFLDVIDDELSKIAMSDGWTSVNSE